MNQDNRKHSLKDRKYSIVPYNKNWVNQFDDYKLKIKSIFNDAQFEHIGSTSIPGMSGKDCIDVLVIVADLKIVEENIEKMERLGFEYAGTVVAGNSRLFRVMNGNTVLANIHFFPCDHPHIPEMLDFRNFLLCNPEEVLSYSSLKNDLCAKYPNDYASYRKYKDEYMEEMKKRFRNV